MPATSHTPGCRFKFEVKHIVCTGWPTHQPFALAKNTNSGAPCEPLSGCWYLTALGCPALRCRPGADAWPLCTLPGFFVLPTQGSQAPSQCSALQHPRAVALALSREPACTTGWRLLARSGMWPQLTCPWPLATPLVATDARLYTTVDGEPGWRSIGPQGPRAAWSGLCSGATAASSVARSVQQSRPPVGFRGAAI